LGEDPPRYRFGHMSPLMAKDNRNHEASQVFPATCGILCYPLNLKDFSGAAVDEALGSFWAALEHLAANKVRRIALGGIPVAALPGRKRILSLLDQARNRTDIPVTAVFEDVIEAFKALSVRRIAVAAKWDRPLMQAVADYLADAGIAVVGESAKPHTAAEVLQIGETEGTDMAIELGRQAFRTTPDAEALLVAGGAWRSLEAVPILEKEFGKPVINNSGAEFWASMKLVGERSPKLGWGRLIDSLHGAGVTRTAASASP
jgi:maleate cis-trans isomerase